MISMIIIDGVLIFGSRLTWQCCSAHAHGDAALLSSHCKSIYGACSGSRDHRSTTWSLITHICIHAWACKLVHTYSMLMFCHSHNIIWKFGKSVITYLFLCNFYLLPISLSIYHVFYLNRIVNDELVLFLSYFTITLYHYCSKPYRL